MMSGFPPSRPFPKPASRVANRCWKRSWRPTTAPEFESGLRKCSQIASGRRRASGPKSRKRCLKDFTSQRRDSSGESELQIGTARSWAIFCVAVWLAGTFTVAVVATENFFTIDRLLEAKPNPAFAADVEKLGHDATRELLRDLSSELNRLYFQYWNVAQLAV